MTSIPSSTPDTTRNDALREFAEDVARQFGYWVAGAASRQTANVLSTLEEAFSILDWEDPHPLPDSRCVWPDGCMKRGDSGILDELSRQFERALITRALAHTGGRRIEASVLLGMGRNTLTRKIQELGLGDETGREKRSE